MQKAKKQSTKKGDPLEIVSQTLLTVEYKEKSTLLHIERWRENLVTIGSDLRKLNESLDTKDSLSSNDLNKNILKIKNLLSKTSKELEFTQKQQAKLQAEFEKDFESPFSEGLFSLKDPSHRITIDNNIQKINGVFTQGNQILSVLSGECQTFHQRLIQIEEALNQRLLPEQITEAVKQSEDLNQRLTSIYKTMESLKNREPQEKASLKAAELEQSFLPLCAAHAQEALLLSQIKALSMAPTDPCNDFDANGAPALSLRAQRGNPEKH